MAIHDGFMNRSKALLIAIGLLVLACTWVSALEPDGTVIIAYTLHRIPKMASNQLAVWIEDAEGRFVRTLFATDFMARRRGFLKRPQVCPEWVRAADLGQLDPKAIDAVSGATQKPGPVTLVWDCTAADGRPVAPGPYLFKVEGNLFWEKRVLWTGRIEVGTAASESAAAVQYLPDASSAQEGVLVEGVTARFQPRQ
jgi:hypothetical protein